MSVSKIDMELVKKCVPQIESVVPSGLPWIAGGPRASSGQVIRDIKYG